MCSPELAAGDILGATPGALVSRVLGPLGAEIAVEQTDHFMAQPSLAVDAIGDSDDGDLVFGKGGKNVGPHFAGDLSMQVAHGIGVVGQAESQNGHAEILFVVLGLLAAQAHEVIPGKAQTVGVVSEILMHQVGGEHIVSGRDGGMSGEDVARRTSLAGL